jgi:hypothetical protein
MLLLYSLALQLCFFMDGKGSSILPALLMFFNTRRY